MVPEFDAIYYAPASSLLEFVSTGEAVDGATVLLRLFDNDVQVVTDYAYDNGYGYWTYYFSLDATWDLGSVHTLRLEVYDEAGENLLGEASTAVQGWGAQSAALDVTLPAPVDTGAAAEFYFTGNVTNGSGQLFYLELFDRTSGEELSLGSVEVTTDFAPGAVDQLSGSLTAVFNNAGTRNLLFVVVDTVGGYRLAEQPYDYVVSGDEFYPAVTGSSLTAPTMVRKGGATVGLSSFYSFTASAGRTFMAYLIADNVVVANKFIDAVGGPQEVTLYGAYDFPVAGPVKVTSTFTYLLDGSRLGGEEKTVQVTDTTAALTVPNAALVGAPVPVSFNAQVSYSKAGATFKYTLTVDDVLYDQALFVSTGKQTESFTHPSILSFNQASWPRLIAKLVDVSSGEQYAFSSKTFQVTEPERLVSIDLLDPPAIVLGGAADIAAVASVTNGLGRNFTLRVFVNNQPFVSETKASTTGIGAVTSFSVLKSYKPTDQGVVPVVAELLDATGAVLARDTSTLTVAPKPDADTAVPLTWRRLDTGSRVGSGAVEAVAASTSWRLLCEVPASRWNTGYGQTRSSAYLVNHWGSSQALLLFETSPGVLEADIYGSDRAHPTYEMADEYGNSSVPENNVVEYAKRGFMPRATVAAMWGDVLCVADTAWYSDSTNGVANYRSQGLNDGNTSRYRSGFWSSYVSPAGIPEATAFHPVKSFNYGFLSPEAVIVDMRVSEAGLLLFTRESGDNDGIVLLRGKPYDYKVVVVRGHIGLQPEGKAGEWQDAGVFAFVDTVGKVWQTDGTEADRLDRIGPLVPRDLAKCKYDQAAPIGSWLWVLRSGTLTLLNLLDRGANGNGEAAWTSLVTPKGDVTQLLAVGQSMYMVAGGQLYRFSLLSTDRALVAGRPIVSTATTAVLGDPNALTKMRWARIGVRAHSATGSGRVLSIDSIAGSIREVSPAPRLSNIVDTALLDSTNVVARGHGRSRLASFQAKFSGDVTVDAFEVLVAGKSDDRTEGEN